MAIENSNLSKFGVDFQDGSGMWTFPVQPSDMQIQRMGGEPERRLDGTENLPKYWDMVLKFSFLTTAQMLQFTTRWNPKKQKIILNYASGKYYGNPAGTTDGSGWVRGNAVWNEPPITTVSQIRGIILWNLVLTLTKVEWDGVRV
jgi:hypothetical protein